jgi:hypothetical protein
MANNDNVEGEIENSNEEFMAVAERNFKQCTRPPKDHFKKILEAACPHHLYPVKYKLRDCTMMKRFLSSAGTPLGGDKPARGPRGGGYDPEPGTLCGQPGLGPLLVMTGTQTIVGQAKYCLHSMQSPVMLGNSGNKPNEMAMKSKSQNILHQNKTKTHTKCYCRADTGDGDVDNRRLLVPNPRGHGRSHRPPSRAPGSHPTTPRMSLAVHGSRGIPEIGGIPRFSRM